MFVLSRLSARRCAAPGGGGKALISSPFVPASRGSGYEGRRAAPFPRIIYGALLYTPTPARTMDHRNSQPRTLATILDLSRLVSSSLDLDVVLERILRAVHDLSAADIISVMMLDESGAFLRIVAAHGIAPAVVAETRLRVGEGIAGWVAQHETSVHVAGLAGDPRYVAFSTPPDATIFALPLRVRERTLGVLSLSRLGQATLFSPETVQMLEIFASHAAIAVDNAATVTSLRYAAARERVAGIVHQAARSAAGAVGAAREILADLGATLEDAACAIYLPGERGAFTLLAAAPAGSFDDAPHWHPADLSAQIVEARDSAGIELQIEVDLPVGPCGWVVVRRGHDHFWRRAERDLAAFAADQAALLLRNEQLVSQERQSRALSLTLSRLAVASNALVGQERLLDFILEQLAQFVAYDSTGVFLLHDDQYARMAAGRGFRQAGAGVVLYTGPGSLIWGVLQERRAISVPDVQLAPGWQPVPDADVIRAWIGAPLQVHGEIIGVLTIDKWTPEAFSEADVQLAQLFADHVAVAINSQRLIDDARIRARQLQVVHQASDGLRAIDEVRPMLDEVARLLHASFGHYQVYLCLVDGDELVLEAACGQVTDVEQLTHYRRYSVERGLTGWVVRHNQTVLANNVAADERYFANLQMEDTQAELVVPISYDGRVSGVIAVQSARQGVFAQSDVDFTEAVAGLAAMALERIRRDEELRAAQEQLARNERLRALGELASGVAHDFNNLLASILGHTQLLLAEQHGPVGVEELRVIEQAALDGAATVRRLQSFAQTSKAVPAEPVWLGEIVTESLALTRPHWRDGPQSRGVRIEVVREINTIPPFLGDGAALREVVMNLILNAVDAMPEGGTLGLSAELLRAELSPLGEPVAQLVVEDTGHGMSEEVRRRIFEPFFTTKGASGTGMGLAMAYGIIQRHQGLIGVESEPGRGTRFEILIPVRQASPPEGVTVTGAARAEPPLQVLVVDDDEGVRRVLARQIERLGHAVDEASSGEAALECLARRRYDLLCTDLGMPGMSGWELIATARSLYGHLATVLVTGWGNQIDLEDARARGVDAVIAKPFDILRLRQVIDAVRPRALKQLWR